MDELSLKSGLTAQEIEEIAKYLGRYPEVEMAKVFGSRALGSYKEASDVDIAIFGAGVTNKIAGNLKYDIEEDSYMPYFFDVINYNDIKVTSLKEHIDKYGVVIYRQGWREYKIEDFIQLEKSTYKPSETEDLKYIGLEHIEQQALRLNGYGSSKEVVSNKFFFKKGDVLFGKLRPYFRKVIKAPFNGVCSTDIWVCRAKEISDQNFLFYFMANNEFVNTANSADSGTRMPRADWDYLKNTVWELPPLPEQKAIAAILSSLDDKIDLLNRQNKTLEALAETYFRQWFIEEAGENREVGKLGDYVNFDPKEKVDKRCEHMFFDMKCLSTDSMIISDGVKRSAISSSIFRNYDTLLAKITPCLENGKTGFVMCLDENEIGLGSTEFVVMRTKGIASPYWIYCLSRSSEFREAAILSMNGTSGRQRVQVDMLKEYTVAFSLDRMDRFNSLGKKCFDKIFNNSQQIRTLTALRDTLLPKLISGDVRVKM